MKSTYIPPQLTVVEFRVENGFIGSGGPLDIVFYTTIFDNTKDDNNIASSYTTEDWNWD